MKKQLLLLLAILCFSLRITVNAEEEILGSLNLDTVEIIGTTLETDEEEKVEGFGSVKITTAWDTVICLGEIEDLDVDHAKLIFQAKVKCKNLKGNAYLEMWCHIDKGQYYSRGLNSSVVNTMNWKTLKTPFFLQTGQKTTKVTLNIVINGSGTVWVDDIKLIKAPLN